MSDIKGYWAILFPDPDDATTNVRFPDHPNIFTYGEDREHALEMAIEALNATLSSEFDRNLSLPPVTRKPRAKRGEAVVFVPLDPQVRTAFLVRGWREKSGLTQAQVAKRMGITTQAYQRMERPGSSNLTVATLMRIAHAMGKELELSAA